MPAILLLRHWMLYNQRVDEIQSTTLHSELRFLKNQINPHFLFNMLNNANVLIRKNPAEASKVLFKLEDLLRYQMNDNFREHVPLRSDIHFLNDYLNLERYGAITLITISQRKVISMPYNYRLCYSFPL